MNVNYKFYLSENELTVELYIFMLNKLPAINVPINEKTKYIRNALNGLSTVFLKNLFNSLLKAHCTWFWYVTMKLFG